MTLQEAIAVVSDMLTNHLRTPDDIAIETLLAHARAALAPQGVTDAMKVTEAMLQAGARTMARKYAARCGHDERDVWAIYGNDFRDDARDVLTAALAASARGAAS